MSGMSRSAAKEPCSSLQDLSKPNTCQKLPETCFSESFFVKEGDCASLENLAKPPTCHRIPGASFVGLQKLPAEPGRHPHYMDDNVFFAFLFASEL